MATYLITAPDGKKYKVSGEGSQEDALSHFQAQYAAQDAGRQDRIAAIKVSDPSEYDPSSKEYQAKYGPTRGFLSNAAAGAGKFLYDAARGVGQMTGLNDQASVDEAKRLDAPLMRTGGGKVGNIAGGAVFSAPAMLIPGANTAAGAALIGAGTGLMQPV